MNMNNLMAQAQKMQKDIEKKQKEINESTYIGESEWVRISLKGDKTIEKVDILYNNIKDEDDIECLEDMIKIAFNNGIEKINKDIESKMGMYSKLAGGLF